MSPGVGTVVVVVGGALVVGLVHEGAGLLFGEVGMALADATDAVGFVGGDEDVDDVWLVAQDIVGTTAYEDARTLLGEVADGIALNLEQGFVAQLVAIEAGVHEGHVDVEEFGEQACLFVLVLKHFFAEATLLGGHVDEGTVVDGDVEFLGQQLADELATASELATYVDEVSFFHIILFL